MKNLIGKLLGFNQTIYDLKNSVESLRADIGIYKKRTNQLRIEIENVLLDKYQKPMDDISVDFYTLNAVSIEQTYYPGGRYLYTEITFITPKGETDTITLNISNEKHKELLEEFDKYKVTYNDKKNYHL